MPGIPHPRPLDAIVERFRREFGEPRPRCFFAPGRINLVGAHLDYNGGDVLPMAVDRGLYAAVRLRSDGRLRLCSVDQDLAIDVDGAEVGVRTRAEWGWAGYPIGVWHGFLQRTSRGRVITNRGLGHLGLPFKAVGVVEQEELF